jgi:membrane protein
MAVWHLNWRKLVRATGHKWLADNCLRLGAAVSYYTLFSVFPLFLVILAIVQALLRDSTAARDVLLDALARVTGGFRDEFVATLDAVQGAHTQTGVVGVVLLVMGASWVFAELVSAFNIIWGVESAAGSSLRAWARSTFFSFALVLASAFLLLVSMVISALLLIFAMLLKSLPQTSVAWGDVWLGAILTALAWSALQGAIGLVIAWSNYGNYGTIGAVLALVAWVYSSSQILFFGAEFSVVFAQNYGSRRDAQLAPEVHTPEPTAHALPQQREGSST